MAISGLPGGFIIYQGHRFPQKDTYAARPFFKRDISKRQKFDQYAAIGADGVFF